jgi:hypothetical protein
MSRRAALAAASLVGALALAPAGAAAKTTPNFSFKSKGTAVTPGSVAGAGEPGTFENFPFTIAPNQKDGDISVHVEWLNPADDWDLYVYRKGPHGELETVGSSAGGAPSTEENAVTNSQGLPITPGQYIIQVQNYAATSPNFTGTARFGKFVPYNQIPIAKLTARPTTVARGKQVTLDASASHDPDGTIANYSFDLDGNGSCEVNNGKHPVLKRVLGPGVHHVAVRVTDDKGLRAFHNATVTVKK